jgi:hypothetical protein
VNKNWAWAADTLQLVSESRGLQSSMPSAVIEVNAKIKGNTLYEVAVSTLNIFCCVIFILNCSPARS